MHRFVCEDPGSGLGQIALGEQWDRARTGAHRTPLKTVSKFEHVLLSLQPRPAKVVAGGRLVRFATQPASGDDKKVRMPFVVILKTHGQFQDTGSQ